MLLVQNLGKIIKGETDKVFLYAQGRNRTGTPFSQERILSPQRLPIPPPGRHLKNNYLKWVKVLLKARKKNNGGYPLSFDIRP